MGYIKQTLRGASWIGMLRVVTRGIAIGKVVVLARLLSPEQFGLFGIASLVLAYLEIFTETGINVFFVQGEGKLKEYLNTAWVISILRGVLISSAIILAAPFISTFFNTPNAYYLILLIAFVPSIRGFINPAEVQFQINLEFNKEFWFRFAIFTIDALVTLITALLTRSPSSFIWGLAAGALAEVILSFAFIKPHPRFLLETEKVKQIMKRGYWVTSYSIFNYIYGTLDNIVIGKLMNPVALGIYQLAYKISSLPITEISEVAGKVTFPVLTKISGDYERIKSAYFKTMLSVAILSLILGIFVIFFADTFLVTLLGKEWVGTTHVIKILAVFGAVRAILNSGNTLFLAVKKQEYVTQVGFVSVVVLAITIIPLVNWYGIVGAGYSVLLGTIISVPVFIYNMSRTFRSLKNYEMGKNSL